MKVPHSGWGPWLLASLLAAALGCAVGQDPNADTGGVGIDAHIDARGDAHTTTCMTNADCANSAGRLCDTSTHTCVECLPTVDMCPTGRVCDPTTRTCVMGCHSDNECTMGTGLRDGGAIFADGGVPDLGARHCSPAHVCVECVSNDQCPQGAICAMNQCINGCSTSRPCPAGLSCCSGMCTNTLTDIHSCGTCGHACSTSNLCCAGTCADPASNVANCGACGHPCAPANAMGRCASSMCSVATCNAGWADVDHMASNGCECPTGSGSSSCNGAMMIGPLAVGGMQNLAGAAVGTSTEQWFAVQFTAGGAPALRFATNPGGIYRLDVQTACTAGSFAMCPDRVEGGTALQSWEFSDNPPMGGMMTMRMTPAPDTMYVRVYATSMPATCMPYTLTASN